MRPPFSVLSMLGEIIKLFRGKLKLMQNIVCVWERVSVSGSELAVRLLTEGIFGVSEVSRVKQKVMTLTLLSDQADPSLPLQLLKLWEAISKAL